MINAIFIYVVAFSFIFTSTFSLCPETKVGNTHKVDSLFFCLLFVFLTSLIFGLRYNVGTDYKSYELLYYENNLTENRNSRLELFYTFLSSVFFYLKLPYWCFTLFLEFSKLFLFFLYYNIRKDSYHSINSKLLWFFYFATNFLFLSLNIQRHAIAVTFFFCSLSCIEKNKFLKFLIWIFIGAGFHYSILIMLPIYFTYRIYKKLPCIKLNISLIIFILSFLFQKQFSDLFIRILVEMMKITPYKHYGSLIKTWNIESTHGFGVIVRFFMCVLGFMFYKSLKLKYGQFFEIIFFVSFIGNFLSNLFSSNILLNRLIFPFTALNIFLYSMIFQLFYERKRMKYQLIFYFGLFTFFIYFVGQILSSNSNCSPYYFIFWKGNNL